MHEVAQTTSLSTSPAPAAVENPELPVTNIEPASGWGAIDLRELWLYRELLVFFVWRDVTVRYKQTALGVGWAIVQPMLMMLIFSVVLGRNAANAAESSTPYPVFVFSGLLLWMMFANGLNAAAMSLVYSEHLVTKVYFPRLIVPFSAVGTAVLDFGCGLVVFGGLLAWYQIAPTWQLLAAIPAFFLAMLAALAVGTFLAAINVRYRDFRLTVPFLIQAWMFATPAIYLRSTTDTANLSPWLQWLLLLNPLNGIITFFRAAFLADPLPWSMLGWAGLWVGVALVIGCLYFRRVEDMLADVI